MHVKDIMTKDPACCDKDASVQDAAKLMVGNDCGEIPVVDDQGGLVGVVTDRDICCRVVAEGKSPDTGGGHHDPFGCHCHAGYRGRCMLLHDGEQPGPARSRD